MARRETWAIGGFCGLMAVLVAFSVCCAYWQRVDSRLAVIEQKLTDLAGKPNQQQNQTVNVSDHEKMIKNTASQIADIYRKGLVGYGKPMHATE